MKYFQKILNSGALLAAVALPMPPRTASVDWSSQELLFKLFPTFQRVEPIDSFKITSEPIYHSGFKLEAPNSGIILNADGSRKRKWIIVRGQVQWSETIIRDFKSGERDFFEDSTPWTAQHPRGRYSVLSDQTLNYYVGAQKESLWNHRFLHSLVGIHFAKSSSDFVAWSQVPPTLYTMIWGRDRYASKSVIQTYYWSPQSEIVDFIFCSPNRALLVENMPDGLVRIVLFEMAGLTGLRPVAYLDRVFDTLSSSTQAQEVTAIQANLDCSEIYLAGSFGLVREKYPWRP